MGHKFQEILMLLGLMSFVSALESDKSTSVLENASEGPVLSDRLRHPWNQFFLNTQLAYGVEDFFYGERKFSSSERFSLMPGFLILPTFTNDSVAKAGLGGDGGGTMGSEGYAKSSAWTKVTSQSRLVFEGEQNSQMSTFTFPRRQKQIGAKNPEEYSWIGSDLPLLSLLRTGGELEQRGGLLRIGHARGFQWSQSALTGETYPLEVQGTEIRAGVDEELNMRFRYFDYQGISEIPGNAPHATLSEVGLSVRGDAGSIWSWNFDWSYRKRTIDRGSTWLKMDRASYPWAFRGGRQWKGEEILWKINSRMGIDFDESVMQSRVVIEAEIPWKKNVLLQNVRIYHRQPWDDTLSISEILPGDPTTYSSYFLPENSRGFASQSGYVWKDSMWEAGFNGTISMEWQNLEFVGNTIAPVGNAELFWLQRYGEYRGSDYALTRGQSTLFTEAKWGRVRFRTLAGVQEFYGKQASTLEFSPSTYYAEVSAKLTPFHGLRGEIRLQGMGPKTYRGYGVELQIPRHLENHIGLEQSLLSERIRLRAAVFHAFGEDIREHPLGNPLKFRITGGVTWLLK